MNLRLEKVWEGLPTGYCLPATVYCFHDELNRLKSATEMNTPTGGSESQSWKQTYSFDRFGNRRFDTTSGATGRNGGGRESGAGAPGNRRPIR